MHSWTCEECGAYIAVLSEQGLRDAMSAHLYDHQREHDGKPPREIPEPAPGEQYTDADRQFYAPAMGISLEPCPENEREHTETKELYDTERRDRTTN